MATQSGVATSDKVLNVSGLLLARTNVSTPIFNMIGANDPVNHDEFVLGAMYDMETGHQDGVSEQDSLVAPTPTFITRENLTNVTQIFHRAVDVSYKTQSQGGDLSGNTAHLAGMTNSIGNMTEFDWQLARKIEKVRDDIEYAIINSVFNRAATAADTQRTRGLVDAIETNVVDAATDELNSENLNAMLAMVAENSPMGADRMVLLVNPAQLGQFTKNLINLYGQTPRISAVAAGANVVEYISPWGTIGIMSHRYIPNGTALAVKFDLLRNQWQPVPNKGAIFYEALAKVGASERGQIYAQYGLDYGYEFAHAKITNLADTTTPTVPAG